MQDLEVHTEKDTNKDIMAASKLKLIILKALMMIKSLLAYLM